MVFFGFVFEMLMLVIVEVSCLLIYILLFIWMLCMFWVVSGVVVE